MNVCGAVRGLALSGWVALAAVAGAQQPDAVAVKVAPRSARLTFVAGSVQAQRADNTADDVALLNMPVVEGTRLVTGDYGQAEVEFEDGSVVRITPRSAVVLTVLSVDSGSVAHTQVTVLGGLAYFELRKASTGTYGVDAGGVQATPVENVTLRVNVDEPPATFAVLSGTARLERPDAFTTVVRTGETLKLDVKDDTRYFLQAEVAAESWDRWNQDRDEVAANDADRRTAARDAFAGSQGYGWSDLDADGTWYDVPDVGRVWQPVEAAGQDQDGGFDPYSNGAWVWGSGGYVYVSAYNWGWTPFHCGSWVFYPAFGWAWVPDASCGSWGYSGFAESAVYFYGGSGGRRPVPIPRPGPGSGGGFHPTLPVRAPHGFHPPRPRPLDVPVKIAGSVAKPLPPVGVLSHRDNPVGKALERDYPVDSVTQAPVYGVIPGSAVAGSGAGSGPGRATWTPRGGNAVDASRPVEGSAGYRAPSAGTVAAPVQTRPARPVPTEPARQVYHPAPAAPAPASHPAAAPPAPAPAHTDATTKPK